MVAAFSRGNLSEAGSLVHEFARQRREEERIRSEREAQARAHTTYQDSADYEEEDDEEEFAQPQQVEVEPDQTFTVTVKGNPAKTAGLHVRDLIRRGGKIEKAQYVSTEDGVVRQYCKSSICLGI